ncbi:hypothetical protein [Arthrobacter methylotrophus]|uniref:hypothetical protein n=1 Tax=Arthrobacter methylotrophus TaxID=121291 RepID=UPI0031EE752A
MTSSCNEGVLRQYYVRAHLNVVLVVNPHPLANPSSISYFKFPRKSNARSGAVDNAGSNFCSKQTENAYPQGRTDLPRIRDKEQFSD